MISVPARTTKKPQPGAASVATAKPRSLWEKLQSPASISPQEKLVFAGGGLAILLLLFSIAIVLWPSRREMAAGEEETPSASPATSTVTPTTIELPESPKPKSKETHKLATVSPLKAAIDRGLAPGGQLVVELDRLGQYGVVTPADAEAVCDTLEKLPIDQPPVDGVLSFTSPLRELTLLFERVRTPAAQKILTLRGLPQLEKIFDERINSSKVEDQDDLLLMLKIFASYYTKGGAERIIEAARKPLGTDDPTWAVVLGLIDQDHPQRDFLLKELAEPVPPGIIAQSLLEVSNRLAIEGAINRHPLDTPAGRKKLASWLAADGKADFHLAHAAASAVAHLEPATVGDLTTVGMAHPDPYVRMEAAWAAAKIGNAAGIDMLAAAAAEVNTSFLAIAYLDELGKMGAVPEAALTLEFTAAAEMSFILSKPDQFGRPPDELELVDKRELLWPPARERRKLFVFRFRYKGENGTADRAGKAMLGGMVNYVSGPEGSPLSPETLYALRCCSELDLLDDAQKPEKLSVEAGRAILQRYNPDFGVTPATLEPAPQAEKPLAAESP